MTQHDLSRPQPQAWAYLEQARRRVLVYDGAMGTSIQNLELTGEDYGGKEGCNEYLALIRPEIISTIHREFLEAGADVLETDTFGGSRLKLDEYGLGERTLELNRAAAGLARQAADAYSTPRRPRFVAGSMGPTGMLPSSDDATLGNITYEQLAEIYREQAQGLVEGGCDLLLIETSQDILEVKAAIAGIRRYFAAAGRRVPIQAQVTLDVSGRMLLGTDIGAVLVILEALEVDVLGLNCSTGPQHMREPVRYLCANSRLLISVIPNAGLPLNVGGKAVYPLEPSPMADQMAEFIGEFGVDIVGGCCGTTPEHIRELRQRVDQLQAQGRRGARPARLDPGAGEPMAASPIRSVGLVQEPPPALVGERVNTVGSRKVKRLLLNDQYDEVVAIARDQVDGGAHLLDVCVATTDRMDEADQMRILVKKLGMSVEAPLVIDSTEADVMKAALETYGGRAVLNSVNLENGRLKADAVLPLAKEHGAAVVAMTIDEQGMARTAERKFAVAQRLYTMATEEFGLAPGALIFDTLVLPLSTGMEEERNAGVETITAIRRIKAELPGALTVLGISNVSFGLTEHARAVLNSVFLHHTVEAGLDLAIVNPKDVMPYAEIPIEQRSLTDDVVFNRHPEALVRFIAYFEEHAPQGRAGEPTVNPMEGLSVAEAIHYQILHRIREGIEAKLDLALLERTPVAVLNEVLLPAMKDVGDRFGAGELILPFVLQSAEVMKRAVAHLEQFLEKKEGYTKGKVVLATVFGDVHDIGKNLVNTILTNNGYTVYDLGKQVPMNTIIDKAVEVGADAIGLSALLVNTSKQMPLIVQELHKRSLGFPVVVGGAAINRAYGYRILFTDGVAAERPYDPGVFYAKDAFEGLEIMDILTDPARARPFVERVRGDAHTAMTKAANPDAAPPRVARIARIAVDRAAPIPTPPFWGARTMEGIELARVFKYLSLRSLFRLSWGGKNAHGAAWTELLRTDFMPRLRRMQREALRDGYLTPRVAYGYFPCHAEGDDLVVFDAQEQTRETARFHFPRQDDDDHLCIADYFAPASRGRKDVVALQVVTLGPGATERTEALQAAGEYSEMFFVHGLSVETAEALAEYAHRQVRAELGIPYNQGKRYSWGYPACPDLTDHVKVFGLLPAPAAIGVNLTDACQLVPEQSTAAIIIHHPQATYFMVREGKRDVQLAAAAQSRA